MFIFDIFRTLQLSVGQTYRYIKKKIITILNSTVGYSGFIPEHLVIAPQDLRTCDPVIPRQFAQGQYALAGHNVSIKEGSSPFGTSVKNQFWNRELHTFSWLQHFKDENAALVQNLAQDLVKEWLILNPTITRDQKWDIEITAIRLISWLCHSTLILKNTNPKFHDDLMLNIGMHTRYLHRHAALAETDIAQLYAYMALIYAALCRKDIPRSFNQVERRFSQQLRRQILNDGAHIDRNPSTVLKILALLLPLKEAYIGRERPLPDSLDSAIVNLFQALHFFRMGDGNLARFNGSGITERDLLITLMRYDKQEKAKLISLANSGYERLEKEDAILIMDVGAAPEGKISEACHAGCLAFEFSSGTECIIVNSGTPNDPLQFGESVWRKTEFHSTAILNKTSSCKFHVSKRQDDPFSGQIFSNKLRVNSERKDDEIMQSISAAHLGYIREFGARHERSVILDNDGKKLKGIEWFSAADKSDLRYSINDKVNVRFHLHPDVSVKPQGKHEHCILTLRSGNQWKFSAEGFTISVEESTYFANHSGPRKTRQIVITARISDTPEIGWALEEIK